MLTQQVILLLAGGATKAAEQGCDPTFACPCTLGHMPCMGVPGLLTFVASSQGRYHLQKENNLANRKPAKPLIPPILHEAKLSF